MNYRHIYHAGNFADVYKHAMITAILEYLLKKDAAFTVYDVHAGVGFYKFDADEMQRSPEYQQGIARVMQATLIPELASYLKIVKSYQSDEQLVAYPGSPLIVKACLRAQDDMIINELHHEDFLQLKHHLKNHTNIHFHQRDAYEMLPALLPPKNKRGLIIIDPPYEKTDELQQIKACLQKCLKRFSNGIYLVWYPIVSKRQQNQLKKWVAEMRKPLLHAYFTQTTVKEERQGMIGTGVIVLNPPWQLDKTAAALTRHLCDIFKRDERATWKVELLEN